MNTEDQKNFEDISKEQKSIGFLKELLLMLKHNKMVAHTNHPRSPIVWCLDHYVAAVPTPHLSTRSFKLHCGSE